MIHHTFYKTHGENTYRLLPFDDSQQQEFFRKAVKLEKEDYDMLGNFYQELLAKPLFCMDDLFKLCGYGPCSKPSSNKEGLEQEKAKCANLPVFLKASS